MKKKRPPVISSLPDVTRLLLEKGVKIFGISSFPSKRSDIRTIARESELLFRIQTGETDSVRAKNKIKCFPQYVPGTKLPIRKMETLVSDQRLVDHIKKRAQNKLAGIYLYRSTAKIESVAKRNRWKVLANPENISLKLDNRLEFYRILREIGMKRNFSSLRLSELEKGASKLFSELGDKLVVQTLSEGGGRGTFFVNKRTFPRDLAKIKRGLLEIGIAKDPLLIANRFAEGRPVSITGCITRKNGILSSYLQYQLIGIKDLVGKKSKATFCGHDWALSKEIPAEAHARATALLEKFGQALKKRGGRGIFGLDLIWDKETGELFPIEINPRLLGSFPIITQVQLLKKEVPLLAFHILEFLNIDYRIKSPDVYRNGPARIGSHLILFNQHNCPMEARGDLPGGVYSLDKKGALHFLRKGFELTDLVNEKELLITGGVPKKGSVTKERSLLLRLASLNALSKKQGAQLTEEARLAVSAIYKKLDLAPYE